MSKVAMVTQVLEKRILHSDHILAGIPGERQLAEELGLSRTTVRAAIQKMVQSGTLVRHENGRLGVAGPEQGRRKVQSIGFLTPVGPSADFELWRNGVRGVLQGHPAVVHSVTYGHWADRALQEALAVFDGIFLIPVADEIPAWLVSKMLDSSRRVVVLDQDETESGLPSVIVFPPATEHKLFDHLVRLGHRRIDCLNTQEENAVIMSRISVWKSYIDERGLSGQLHSVAMKTPIETAYAVIGDTLRQGYPVGSSMFCTTGPSAMGAMRAMQEAGLEIGVDVSVCTVNSEGIGRYLLRSLTELEPLPRAMYLRQASEWMLHGGDWQGPLLVQPDDVAIFQGESTGPAPASPVVYPVHRSAGPFFAR